MVSKESTAAPTVARPEPRRHHRPTGNRPRNQAGGEIKNDEHPGDAQEPWPQVGGCEHAVGLDIDVRELAGQRLRRWQCAGEIDRPPFAAVTIVAGRMPWPGHHDRHLIGGDGCGGRWWRAEATEAVDNGKRRQWPRRIGGTTAAAKRGNPLQHLDEQAR